MRRRIQFYVGNYFAAEVGRLYANVKNAFNSFVGHVIAEAQCLTF